MLRATYAQKQQPHNERVTQEGRVRKPSQRFEYLTVEESLEHRSFAVNDAQPEPHEADSPEVLHGRVKDRHPQGWRFEIVDVEDVVQEETSDG